MSVDISSEAVERLALRIDTPVEVADTLRALTKERDAWRKDSAAAWDKCEARRIAEEALEAERDAARAEVKRLLVLLKDVTDALEPHVPADAKMRQPYEAPLSAYDRARAALAAAEEQQ